MRFHALITGPSGSGKSFLAEALSSLGYPAYDSDTLPGLAHWYDKQGRRVEHPVELDTAFLQTHRYLWDASVLRALLVSRQVCLLFGISHNSAELATLFDYVFVLQLPVDQVLRNLRSNARRNAFGAAPQHQAMARADTELYYRSVPAHWLDLVPGSPAEVISDVERTVGLVIPRD